MKKFLCSKLFYFCLAFAVIASGALILMWPALSGKNIFTEEFIGHYYYIYFSAIKFFTGTLHILPNWWPAYDSGYPINLTLDGFLNPIFLLTLKMLPPFLANNLLIFIFFVINGLSFYALARALQLSKIASLVSAISYAFGGVIVRYSAVTGIAALMPFLPLSFLCCLKIMQGRLKWFWLFLLLLVYSWIGGWAEMIVYAMVAAGVFVLYLIFKERKKENFSYLRPILFFGAFLLSVIILLPWFLSVLNFVSFSQRSGGVDQSVAANAPTTLSHLVHMVYPRLSVFYGNLLPFFPLGDFDNILYIGTLPLLLVFASLFIKAKREKGYLIFFLSLAVGAIFMTINHSPLFWIFHQIPVLKWFQGYWKWSFVIVFSLAILAGYGFDNIKDFFANRFSKKIITFLWILIVIAVLTSGTVAIFGQKIKTAFTDYGVSHYKNTPDRVFNRTNDYYRHNIEKIADSFVNSFSIKNKWVMLMMALWLIVLIHLTAGKYELISFEKWKIAAVLVTFLGSTLPWTGFLTGPPVSRLIVEPETAKYLHSTNLYQSNKLPITGKNSKELNPYRIFLYAPDQFIAVLSEKYKVNLADPNVKSLLSRETMDDNVHLIFNFDTFFNHQTLVLKRLLDVYNLVRRQEEFTKESYKDTTPFYDYVKKFSSEKNLRLMGALNIEYIFTSLELKNGLKPVFTTYVTNNRVPVYIYQNPYFMPRWYFAKEIKWTKAADETALENLQKIDDFEKTTLLEAANPSDSALSYKPSPKDKIELNLYTAGKLVLKTKTQDYRFLIFSESRFPDFWQALINDEKTPIYTANYLYQAVLVPPGENIVEFRYPNLWEQSLISAKLYIAKFLKK